MSNLVYGLLEKVGYLHPLHPILVHVTVGTVMAAFLFALGGWILGRAGFYTTARHIIVLSFFSWFVTFALGLLDWAHYYGGEMFRTIQMKIILAIVLLALQGAVIGVNRKVSPDSKISLILYALCVLVVVALGFYGAELVY